MKQLDFSGRTQLYYQLYDILHNDIRTGVYKPGEMMPTENELIKRFEISRVTVRKAMELLANDGLIVKRRGYGTFVQSQKVEMKLSQVMYFARSMIEHGFEPSVKILESKKKPASKSVAQALGVPENTLVVHLRRLRLIDGMPLRMESTHLLYSKFSAVEKEFAEGGTSLRQFLADNYNIGWHSMNQKIYSIGADAKHAKYLSVSEGTPILYSECTFYTQDGVPGEYTRVYYRGESNYFTLTSNLEY